jgi:hypothetical protein
MPIGLAGGLRLRKHYMPSRYLMIMKMTSAKVLGAIAVLVIATFVYMSFFGIQFISTDKPQYSDGNTVRVSWSNYKILLCDNDFMELGLFKKSGLDWQELKYDFLGFAPVCVDGKAMPVAMPADVITCGFPYLSSRSGEKGWDLQYFSSEGYVDSCESAYMGVTYTRDTMWQSYSTAKAMPGEYMFSLGGAKAYFTVV